VAAGLEAALGRVVDLAHGALQHGAEFGVDLAPDLGAGVRLGAVCAGGTDGEGGEEEGGPETQARTLVMTWTRLWRTRRVHAPRPCGQ
jgi:hypothetical protein